jgi:hypothetical protein
MGSIFWWLLGLSSTGLILLVAAFFFAPVLFQLVLNVVIGFARTALGMIVISLLVGLMVGSMYQHRVDVKRAQIAEAAAEKARQQRDEKAAQVLNADAKLGELKAQLDDQNGKVASYEQELRDRDAAPPAKGETKVVNRCDYTAGTDFERLRGIGNSKAPRRSAKRVRAPR